MKQIVNIAGYQFVELNDLAELREQLRQRCKQAELKGTILLAPEGINIMLAGAKNNVALLLQQLKQDRRFSDIEFKYSYSDFIPFKRLLIKIKKEIITFAVPGINPQAFTAPRVSPQEFKQWLDQGKDLIILDTRNQCEIDAGKFKNAIDLHINNFRNFPQAVKKIPEVLKQKPIVTYCTGGIRCEKAAAYLIQQGFQNVYQLEGGILKYFEECQNAYYEGKCFVFDDRIALNEKLE